MTRLISIVLVAGSAGVAMADAPRLSAPMGANGGFDSRAVLINQQNNGTANRISQEFGDFPSFSSYSFDDITFGSAVNLTSLTVFGTEAGNSAANTAVVYVILDNPNVGANILAIGGGTQIGNDLSFNLTGVSLGAGTYWLTAFVQRDFGVGGQWFWNETGDPVSGSEAWIQNPGGGFGAGTGANPGSTSGFGFGRADMAFVIEGDVVPAPASLALLGLGGLIANRRRR